MLREHDIESSQEQDDVKIFEEENNQFGGKHSMNVEDFKEESGQGPLLRRCNVIDLNCSAEEEEELEDEDDCILVRGMSSGSSSVGMPSGRFNQAMEAAGQTPFSSGNRLNGNSGDFFTYREEFFTFWQ